MINIAVLGYGTVGSGVVEVINTNHESINKRAGDEINIKYVLDLRDFPGDPVEKVLVHDYEVIVNDPEVDIVVEVMGGIEPAYTFVKRALQAGKSVSTSNKALVAKHGSELMEIAKEKNINFLFEASCGGGIPIIRALNSSLTADEILAPETLLLTLLSCLAAALYEMAPATSASAFRMITVTSYWWGAHNLLKNVLDVVCYCHDPVLMTSAGHSY